MVKRIRAIGTAADGRFLLRYTPQAETILTELRRLYPGNEGDSYPVCIVYKRRPSQTIAHISMEGLRRLQMIGIHGNLRYIYTEYWWGGEVLPEYGRDLRELRWIVNQAAARARWAGWWRW